ncbi:hypothetical protein LIER_42452 [Lithospermum erythrorhizon]|uniref:Uncharacterized protein n=1 Tax=Lithospermum erythrorhizon TaxID=34254 RepID=A0AAV3RRU6_LITER
MTHHRATKNNNIKYSTGMDYFTGCLVALNRFISKSVERNLPFFKNLWRMSKEKFSWDDECSKAFEELKRYLGWPQVTALSAT